MRISEINGWEDLKVFILSVLFFVCVGWLGGWIHAHQTVATECKKLGRFYVGDAVFHCHQIEEHSHDQ